jgi:hypothetical protein
MEVAGDQVVKFGDRSDLYLTREACDSENRVFQWTDGISYRQ